MFGIFLKALMLKDYRAAELGANNVVAEAASPSAACIQVATDQTACPQIHEHPGNLTTAICAVKGCNEYFERLNTSCVGEGDSQLAKASEAFKFLCNDKCAGAYVDFAARHECISKDFDGDMLCSSTCRSASCSILDSCSNYNVSAFWEQQGMNQSTLKIVLDSFTSALSVGGCSNCSGTRRLSQSRPSAAISDSLRADHVLV